MYAIEFVFQSHLYASNSAQVESVLAKIKNSNRICSADRLLRRKSKHVLSVFVTIRESPFIPPLSFGILPFFKGLEITAKQYKSISFICFRIFILLLFFFLLKIASVIFLFTLFFFLQGVLVIPMYKNLIFFYSDFQVSKSHFCLRCFSNAILQESYLFFYFLIKL